MLLYNSLTRTREQFVPNEGGRVSMYTCGPTVYHFAHIGNLRTYIMEDTLEKYLTYAGYDVKRVMNITDVGHLSSDADSGEVIDMRSGEATGVILGGVHRGECGKPGELCGILTEEELGTIEQNGECGVFGVLDTKKFDTSSLYPVGQKSDVHAGEATIISTVKNGKKAEYKIEIFDIDKSSDGSKSFRIKVTDKALKALTGGIVRGMSGSPIIQDGKLVGAVTHVMVANPTEGYGIFIENMLNASNARNELPKAA